MAIRREMHLVPLPGRSGVGWFSAARSREFVTVQPRRCVTLVWNVPALGNDPELSRRRRAGRASAYLPAHDVHEQWSYRGDINTTAEFENLTPASQWTRPRLGDVGYPARIGRTEMSQCGSPKSSKKKSGGGRGRSYRPGSHRTSGLPRSMPRYLYTGRIVWHRNWCTWSEPGVPRSRDINPARTERDKKRNGKLRFDIVDFISV